MDGLDSDGMTCDECNSDKHSKRARDMHLLKQLKLLLKDEVTDNGTWWTFSDSYTYQC